ncbi:hypothetical protein D3C73_1174590 [compost metagenome]
MVDQIAADCFSSDARVQQNLRASESARAQDGVLGAQHIPFFIRGDHLHADAMLALRKHLDGPGMDGQVKGSVQRLGKEVNRTHCRTGVHDAEPSRRRKVHRQRFKCSIWITPMLQAVKQYLRERSILREVYINVQSLLGQCVIITHCIKRDGPLDNLRGGHSRGSQRPEQCSSAKRIDLSR